MLGSRRSASRTSQRGEPATTEHAYRDRLDHEDLHGRPRPAAARGGAARPRRRAARRTWPRLPAGPTVRQALAHLVRASSVSRRARSGRRCGRRAATSCSRDSRRPSRCSLPGGAGTTPTSPSGSSARSSHGCSGAPYRDVLQRACLDPLGLARTRAASRAPRAATGYFVDPWSDAASVEPEIGDDRGDGRARLAVVDRPATSPAWRVPRRRRRPRPGQGRAGRDGARRGDGRRGDAGRSAGGSVSGSTVAATASTPGTAARCRGSSRRWSSSRRAARVRSC